MTGLVPLPLGESGPRGVSIRPCSNIRETPPGTPWTGSVPGPVNVVLGAVDDPCPRALAGMEVQGITSRAETQRLDEDPLGPRTTTPPEGVIIRLADPKGDAPGPVQAVHADPEGGAPTPIVASRHESPPGGQAWFSPVSFPELARLTGDQSASSN